MEYNIYSQSGQVKAAISPTDNSTHENSIMGDNVLNMSFTLVEFVRLTVNDYVMFDGEKYKLLEPYRPTKKSTIEYEYNCKFYGTVGDCKKGIVLKLVDGENKPDFALVDSAAVHLQLVVDNINRIKETLDWTVGEVVDNGNREIVYDSTFCFDALNKIAETFETEWWVEGTTINMSRCEFGTQIELGYNQGLIDLTRDDNDKARFFTRLLPIGSKRNVDPKVYGHNRLQLPGGVQFVERNTEYGIVEQAEEQAFSHIYPKRIGYVGTVRAVPTKVDGKDRIVYYFNDTGLNFDPNNYNIEGLVKKVVFQSGELNGRDFEVNFHSNTNEFEIILQYPYEDQQLPGGGLIPKTGDEYILYNLRMPTEYYPIAEIEFATTVDSFLEKYSIDTSVYKAANDYIYFDENNIDLKVGRRIKLLSEEYFDGGYSNSRVIRIVRKIWNPSIMDIEFSNAVSKGRMESLEHDVDGISVAFKEQLNKEALQVLKSWDSSAPSEYNVLSALRNLKTIKKIALRKDAEDSTDFLVQFLAGLDAERIKLFSSLFSKDYLPGHTGFAFTKDEWGRWLLEVDRIIARESLIVPEFIKNRITVANNQTWFTDNGIIESVEEVEGDADRRIIIIAQERGGACTFQHDDLLKGMYLDEIDGGLDFQTVRMTVLELITPYKLRVSVDQGTPPPREELIIVRTGNRTDVDRQNSIFIDGARPAMFYYVNVDSHTIGVDNIAQATGNLKGFNFGDLTGNEPIKERFSNVIRGSNYQEGHFVQKSGNGLGYPVPADRGDWAEGTYYHYDRVSHNGSMWDCAVKETVVEPSESTSDWTKRVSKGIDGIDGKEGQNGADGVNGKDGVSIVFKGELASHPDNPQNGWGYRNTSDKKSYVYQSGAWYQMTVDGVDGANGKDGLNGINGKDGNDGLSIVWQGDSPNPPSNPQKNWAYRDTDNGVVYIYNGTAWVMMVADGSNGEAGAKGDDGNSVFITYHDNPIASKPAKPTGNGTTGGWHTAPSSSCVWMSQKVALNASVGDWGESIQIQGEGIGSLEIGGVNLVVVAKMKQSYVLNYTDDNFFVIQQHMAYVQTISGGRDFFNRLGLYETNTQYTISGVGRCMTSLNYGMALYIMYTDGSQDKCSPDFPDVLTPFQFTSNPHKTIQRFVASYYSTGADNSAISVKLERGNIATAWSPSPEDMLNHTNMYQGAYILGRAYFNNGYRQDVVKYGSAWYKYIGSDGQVQGSWNSANWEPFGGSFESVATGYLWAEGANLAEFEFDNGAMASQEKMNGKPKIYLNGRTGKAGFLDVEIEGTQRNPFVLWDSGRNVFNGDAVNVKRDNVVMPISSTTIYENGFSWGAENSGRIIRLVHYKWDYSTSYGYVTLKAPTGKYFYENGVAYTQINTSRETVELLGYGTPTQFYGWIVLSRVNTMTDGNYGANKKIIYQGVFNPKSTYLMERVWSASLEATGLTENWTVQRLGEGHYKIWLPIYIATTAYHVALTGCLYGMTGAISSNATNVYASLVNKGYDGSQGVSFFEVKTADDASTNDGGFYFEVIGTYNWATPTPNGYAARSMSLLSDNSEPETETPDIITFSTHYNH